MIPFLKQVADIYAANEADSLIDYCFVFPNKRSATFFSHFLKECVDKEIVMPAVTNISDFVGEFSPLIEANRYDQLFTLFDEYRRLPNVDVDFERFLFWGEMLMNDFTDVDRYLVDADALFVNVKRLREISSNYLSEQQLEIIRRFWGEERTRETVDRFWKHIQDKPDLKQHASFMKLWEVLSPLYHAYRRRLEEQGLATQGMLYRNAVDVLARASADDLPYKRYIFVGFNVLSTSEIKILTSLQRLGVADFYWDFNSDAFDMPYSRAGKFLKRNIKEFPSLYPLAETARPPQPKIDIIGVPSNVGQVKCAGSRIAEWIKSGDIVDKSNAINTAVVLPDESLFIPLIHSIPEDISTINVTMGFPMRLSPMAALLKTIVSLQMRSRKRGGEQYFYRDDVKALLNAKALRDKCPDECAKLENEIRKHRLFTIPASMIAEFVPDFKAIFSPIEDHENHHQVYKYLIGLCDYLLQSVAQTDKMQQRFIESYALAINDLYSASDRFSIDMKGRSFLRLIERATFDDTVNFNGEPLRGLQIMGVLETRALDFDNVILMSMNERIFPRRHYSRSFIPDALRHGYGMSTIDFQESIYAYYFYRLISRARNVALLYDARSVGGTKSNELSRYLVQILYFFNRDNVSHTLCNYTAQKFESTPIQVVRDERVDRLLEKFKHEGGKNLSASSLADFVGCPLMFYLKHVEGYSAEDEATDYMAASTYGDIVHHVAQTIYQSFQGPEKNPTVISQPMLQALLQKGNTTIARTITRETNRLFNGLPEHELDTPLVGESLVLSRVIETNIKDMLELDMKMTPFVFREAEKEMKGQLIVDKDLTINVKQIVDRIDEVQGTWRFVDYKTGDEKMMFSKVADLFSADNKTKAIRQLMFYCHIYRHLYNDSRPIKPVIYKMMTMATNGIMPVKYSKAELNDYNSIYPEFEALINEKIKEIFTTPVYRQADDDHACTFCQFKPLCHRQPKKY